MSILDDVRILIGEGLFDEAEKRLIEVLNLNPRDPDAISLLSDVERQIHLQKSLQIHFPTRKQAMEELQRLFTNDQNSREIIQKSLSDWLDQLDPSEWVDFVVACGVSGLFSVAEECIEKKCAQNPQQANLEYIYAWLGQFYFDEGKFVKARQYFERALPLITDKSRPDHQALWKRLKLYQLECVWSTGDRHQAVQLALSFKSELPMDVDVKRMVDRIEKDT